MQRVPYIDYVNDYISYYDEKQAKNEKLLYFQNFNKIRLMAKKSEYVCWGISLVFAIGYALLRENYGLVNLCKKSDDTESCEKWIIQLDGAFLPIICLAFVVPLTFRICEAWSNAVINQLFD